MITAITITGIKYEVDSRTDKYIRRKIGRLDRFLPRHARKSATADVRLKEINRANGNKYEAEVVIKVPHKDITATDSTMNILAAIDIVEAKLATQLKKYKASQVPHIGKTRAVLSKFKRSYAREQE